MKKTTTTRREIQSFAIQYAAYLDATRAGNMRDQLLWGKLLNESQESLGIRLAKLDPEYFAILQRASR
jgi:hypothetical protein